MRGWVEDHRGIKRSLILRDLILSIIWKSNSWTIKSFSFHKNIMSTGDEFDHSVEWNGDIRSLCALQPCVESIDDAEDALKEVKSCNEQLR
jgi:hypothetical protein